MESKKDIRKRILASRKFLTKQEYEEKSNQIYEKVIAHSLFQDADTIFCYMDYQNEVKTCEIIKHAWKLGKKVAVPKVTGADILFYEIRNFADLKEGYKAIPEPGTEDLIESKKGLVIMPGVAFDSMRNRIGYGKGYYDRYLSRHPHLDTIAIAFELQIVDKIPCDEGDIRPEILITEENIYV